MCCCELPSVSISSATYAISFWLCACLFIYLSSFLLTLALILSLSLYIMNTCCYDEIIGTQDFKISTSHDDSLHDAVSFYLA